MDIVATSPHYGVGLLGVCLICVESQEMLMQNKNFSCRSTYKLAFPSDDIEMLYVQDGVGKKSKQQIYI